MRIVFCSNSPWTSTGYGGQVRTTVPRLQRLLGHQLAVIGFYGLEGAVINVGDGAGGQIPVYPKGYAAYGNDVMAAHSTHFKADVTISLIDAWVAEPRMFGQGMRWCPYFPIDHEPLPNIVREKVLKSFQPIVYSRFGERMCQDAGLDVRYVPHCIDTAIYQPGDKAAAREHLELPRDRFIVGMVAANKGLPSRKAFPQCLEAFAMLHRAHPDALLYLHTTKGTEAGERVNLPELADFLGIKDAVIFADQYAQLIGFPDAGMAETYRACDVLLSPSLGEGFGVPILESQACGTPVIVGDWTAMPELLFGGWKIDKADALKFYTPLASYQWIPQPGAIHDALAEAYLSRGSVRWDIAMRQGALQYDADRVVEEYWRPVLDELGERVETNKRLFAVTQGNTNPRVAAEVGA